MAGWHHQLYGSEFEQALGVSDGQGSLACYSPRGCKKLDKSGDWTELKNIQLSKDLSHYIPWSTGCLTPPWTPSGVVEGQQLWQHGVQSPKRQMANIFVVQSLAMFLVSANLWLTQMSTSKLNPAHHSLLQLSFIRTRTCPPVYMLPMPAFMCYYAIMATSAVAAEILWAVKLKIGTLWYFIEEVCWLWKVIKPCISWGGYFS